MKLTPFFKILFVCGFIALIELPGSPAPSNGTPRELLDRAKKSFLALDYKTTQNLLQAALEKTGGNENLRGEALYRQARLLHRLCRPEEALQKIKLISKNASFYPRGLLLRARVLLFYRGWKEAQPAFQQTLAQLSSGNTGGASQGEIAYVRSRTYLYTGKRKESLRHINEALKHSSNDTLYLRQRARAYYKTGQKTFALRDLDRALKLEPDNLKVRLERARFLYRSTKLKEAKNEVEIILKKRPDSFLAHTLLGNTYTKMRRSSSAQIHYEKALESNPRDHVALTNRGNIYMLSYRTRKKALEIYNQALKLNPAYAYGYARRGNYYARKYKRKQAREDYSKAVELRPETPRFWLSRGKYLMRSNRTRRLAIRDFSKAISIAPGSPRLYFFRAGAYIRFNKYDKAKKDVDAAKKIDAKYAPIYFISANLNYRNGECEEAVADLKKFLKLHKGKYLEGRYVAYIKRNIKRRLPFLLQRCEKANERRNPGAEWLPD